MLEARQAGGLLASENAWELRAAAARAESRGVDVGPIIAQAESPDLFSVEAVAGRLDRARIEAGANRAP